VTDEDRLLNAAEVAEMLAVSEGWVYEAARSGDLPCVRLGRHVRFRRPSVLAWVEEQETTSTARRRRPPLRQVKP
jgi:excisionase family DNA binding protein